MKNIVFFVVILAILSIGAGWNYAVLQTGKLGITEKVVVGKSLKDASLDTTSTYLLSFYKGFTTDSLYFVVCQDSVLDTLAVLGVDR